jgi:hypothetical protein
MSLFRRRIAREHVAKHSRIEGIADDIIKELGLKWGEIDEEKLNECVDLLITRLDAHMKFGSQPIGVAAELLDGPVLHLIWSMARGHIIQALKKAAAKKI